LNLGSLKLSKFSRLQNNLIKKNPPPWAESPNAV
jgi:hypothetical protein